ncbi:MAG: hypothetical protein ABIO57_04075 [Candidatus Paceibacterota bacterium]
MKAKDLIDESFQEKFSNLSPKEQEAVITALKAKQTTETPKPPGFTPEKSVMSSLMAQKHNA